MSAEIIGDRFSIEDVRRFIDGPAERRTFNPLGNPAANEELLAKRNEWAASPPCTVSFTLGVYDLFHANHRSYLLHTKLAAAPKHYQNYYQRHNDDLGWEELSRTEKHEFCRDVLANGELKLITSVDGNLAVEKTKGHNSLKGNMPRPIYDWNSRVRDVLNVAVEITPQHWIPVVDAVTMHDNQESSLAGTPNESDISLGTYLQPDVWAIYFESKDTVETVGNLSSEEYTGDTIIILKNRDYYEDPLLNGGFSTTRILGRLASTSEE